MLHIFLFLFCSFLLWLVDGCPTPTEVLSHWDSQSIQELLIVETELSATNKTRIVLGKLRHMGSLLIDHQLFFHGILFFPNKINIISTDQKLMCPIQFQSCLIDTGIL